MSALCVYTRAAAAAGGGWESLHAPSSCTLIMTKLSARSFTRCSPAKDGPRRLQAPHHDLWTTTIASLLLSLAAAKPSSIFIHSTSSPNPAQNVPSAASLKGNHAIKRSQRTASEVVGRNHGSEGGGKHEEGGAHGCAEGRVSEQSRAERIRARRCVLHGNEGNLPLRSPATAHSWSASRVPRSAADHDRT